MTSGSNAVLKKQKIPSGNVKRFQGFHYTMQTRDSSETIEKKFFGKSMTRPVLR
jgi:hypothetical protein